MLGSTLFLLGRLATGKTMQPMHDLWHTTRKVSPFCAYQFDGLCIGVPPSEGSPIRFTAASIDNTPSGFEIIMGTPLVEPARTGKRVGPWRRAMVTRGHKMC